MIFWLVLGISVLGTFIYISNDRQIFMFKNRYSSDTISLVTIVIQAFGYLFSCIMLVCIIWSHINSEANAKAFEKHYDSLVYQMENKLYDNDIGKKKLYDDVTCWNCDLARRKVLSKNFWVGIFYADIYEDFEFIEFGQVVVFIKQGESISI